MISDEDLIDWTKAEEAEVDRLRSLERSAIATLEHRTGRYWGVSKAHAEIRVWRGMLELAAEPAGGAITLLEEHDGTSWVTVPTSSYYVAGRFVRPLTEWAPAWDAPVRVTYTGGYTADAIDPDVWDAPEDIKDAVRLLVAHRFANREAVAVGTITKVIEHGVDALIRDHKRTTV